MKNSVAATSRPSAKSVPASKPAEVMAARMKSSAARGARQVGCEPTLVAEAGRKTGLLQLALERVVDLGAPAEPSAKVSAPIGSTMNSWMSRAVSACAPPLMMFMSGTGSTWAFGPPR